MKTGLIYKVPFLYRFLEIKPSSCTIIITNRCNLRCVMCKQWREPVNEELSTEEWKNIILNLKKNGIRNMHFTGGEPLLRNDFKDLVLFCSRNGFVSGVTTNGFLLTDDILQGLIDAGLRSIALSIDALDSEYEKIRGLPNSFKQLKQAVAIISAMKRTVKIDAYLNFTLMKDNIKDLKKVKTFADEAKLPLAICLLDKNSFIFDLKENSSKFWITEEKDFEYLRGILNFLRNEKIKNPKSLIINFPTIDFIEDYFRDPRQENIPCVSSQDRIIIDPYGNLLGGCMSMGSFGNLKENEFKVLRNDKKYKIAKRNMFYKNCSGCSCGYLFNINHIPSLILKDLINRVNFLTLK